jgi:hypothetical protein
MTKKTTSRDAIYKEIEAERAYQDSKWGVATDDTKNNPFNWVSYLSNYSSRWMKGEFPPFTKPTVEAYRASMIKTAAIAVAAVESLDRQRAAEGKAFYEQEDRAA